MSVELRSLNPFDGALFAGGAVVNSFALITGNSPVLVAIITGVFMCLAKLIEGVVRARSDRRVERLEEQLRNAGLTPYR